MVIAARVALAVALATSLAACSKAEPGKAEGPDGLTAKWTKAGLTVSALTEDKSGAIGPSCKRGTVSGVDVVHCTFPSEAEAKAAEAKALAWVAEATGAALVTGKELLAVADRRSADPSGRTINAVTKAFR